MAKKRFNVVTLDSLAKANVKLKKYTCHEKEYLSRDI